MQFVKPDIQTVCLGQAASAAAVLLAAGTPGKRFALPNSRILIHQPYTEGGGQARDIEIQASEILRMRALLEEMIAEHTSRTDEQVRRDIERDKILTAEEAVEYGLIDQVLTTRKSLREPSDGLRRSAAPGDAPVRRRSRRGTRGAARTGGRRGTVVTRQHRRRSTGRRLRRRRGRGSRVARIGDGGDLLKCSFCGKSQKQVKKLIAGPGVYICDECIDLCNEIIEEELSESSELKWDELPKPREIFEFLDALRHRPGHRQEGARRSRSTTTTSGSRPARPASRAATTTSSSPSPTSC